MERMTEEEDSFSEFCLRTLSPLSKTVGKFVFEEESKRVSCKCKKTKCVKFYCECLSAGSFCNKYCECKSCLNKPNRKVRKRAINRILQKNPDYFQAIVSCNCVKSHCVKKYCECLNQGTPCTKFCKCIGCKNHIN